MYTDEELKDIMLKAIASHQSLDNKLHLMEALTERFDTLEGQQTEIDWLRSLPLGCE